MDGARSAECGELLLAMSLTVDHFCSAIQLEDVKHLHNLCLTMEGGLLNLGLVGSVHMQYC